MIIQIIGLPGSGKTTLAQALLEHFPAIHWNADKVRTGLKDTDFSPQGRINQATRMGYLCREVSEQGHIAIADFVCPTKEAREAFGKADIVIWMDRTKKSKYEDTNALWEDPEYDLRIPNGLTVKEELKMVFDAFSLVDWKAPTTLLLGRYQPWHAGHEALHTEALKRTDQVVIAVRNTHETSSKDPLTYNQVRSHIPHEFILRMPNITNIVYGRDVGYKIEKVSLPDEIEKISATDIRKKMGI